MNTAPATTHTQGCVYQSVLADEECVAVVVVLVLELVPDVLPPDD